MKRNQQASRKLDKPNFLVILVDEERYPPVYENAEIKKWRKKNLIAQELLKENSMEFHRHYIGSSACCPSRATLFTGHYPSLHGVSQTVGIAKESFDSDVHWLDKNTVPTMGDYFREAGYQTHYKGKWHITNADIIVPGTHNSIPSFDPLTGVPDRERTDLYYQANRLDDFGFSDWIGPEPNGKNPRNSASSAGFGISGRDVVYGEETVMLLENLDRQKSKDKNAKPWLVIASFVNPHDIVLYGALTAHLPAFRFEVEPTVPSVSPPPTMNESLLTKPRCQASYRDTYPKALQPIIDNPFYRQLYYQLQKNADQQMLKVYEALARSSFYDNTIVIFTSDHGDLLGSHGNLHQKWYCAYEEFLHVPFLIHNKHLFPHNKNVDTLTSHVDLLPTMLGLANVDIHTIQCCLQKRFSEARPFVGRDLTPIILEQKPAVTGDSPVYFMTDDDVTRGQHQVNPLGEAYASVVQPNHIESVLMTIITDGKKQLWKFSRYYDNVQFWSQPGVQDVTFLQADAAKGEQYPLWATQVKTEPAPEEFELYNLTEDPLEARNLASPAYATQHTKEIETWMMELLNEQRMQKRLVPADTGIT